MFLVIDVVGVVAHRRPTQRTPSPVPLLVRGSLGSRMSRRDGSDIISLQFSHCADSIQAPKWRLIKGHKRFARHFPSRMQVRMQWANGAAEEDVIRHAGDGASRICFSCEDPSVRYAFKFGERAYQQNDNLSEMEEFKRLPEGFTPEVFGYLELTVFDLDVHVLIVEKGDPSPLPPPELA